MYIKIDVIAIAGKTNPTNGTKIDGKYAAVIKKSPYILSLFLIN
jgi:hypothetical protein